MSMPSKSRIEDFAFDYLKSYYIQRHGAKDVHVFLNEKAKNGANADGLLLFTLSKDEPLFVAAIQTEVSEKIANLLTSYKAGSFKYILLVASFISAALLGFLSYWIIGKLFISATLALVLIPILYLAFIFLYRFICRQQLSGLIKKLYKLPANNRWLGISISSRIFKNNKLAAGFVRSCSERGIGLITVGQRSKVVLVLKPENHARRNGDFLSFYQSDVSIRKDIFGDNIMRVA